MAKARCHAYQWCAANAPLHAELQGTNWHYLIRIEQEEIKILLRDAKKQDEETFLMNWSDSEDDARLSGPLDANFLQAHDVFLI